MALAAGHAPRGTAAAGARAHGSAPAAGGESGAADGRALGVPEGQSRRHGSERRAESGGELWVPGGWPSALRCGTGSGRGRAERNAAARVTSCGAVQGAERARGPRAPRQGVCGTGRRLNLSGRVRGAGVTAVSAVALSFLPSTCSGWKELHALLPQTRTVLTMVTPPTPEPPGGDSQAVGC